MLAEICLPDFILTLRSVSLPLTGRLDQVICWPPGLPLLVTKLAPLPLLQVQIAKHALKTLLATNYRFTELVASGAVTEGAEQRIVWLCSGILTNIALHPDNRYGLVLHVSAAGANCGCWLHQHGAARCQQVWPGFAIWSFSVLLHGCPGSFELRTAGVT